MPMWPGSHKRRLHCPDPEGAHYALLTINLVSTDLHTLMKGLKVEIPTLLRPQSSMP